MTPELCACMCRELLAVSPIAGSAVGGRSGTMWTTQLCHSSLHACLSVCHVCPRRSVCANVCLLCLSLSVSLHSHYYPLILHRKLSGANRSRPQQQPSSQQPASRRTSSRPAPQQPQVEVGTTPPPPPTTTLTPTQMLSLVSRVGWALPQHNSSSSSSRRSTRAPQLQQQQRGQALALQQQQQQVVMRLLMTTRQRGSGDCGCLGMKRLLHVHA